MSNTDVETTIKVITFDGKISSWVAWEQKFLARSLKKGYYNILVGDEDEHPIPMDGQEKEENSIILDYEVEKDSQSQLGINTPSGNRSGNTFCCN
jgi:hypothetical protein